MRPWVIGLFLLSIAGAVLIIVGGTTLVAIGVACLEIAAVGAVSIGFFVVGRGEDEARAAETAQREAQGRPENGDGRITSRRPPRSRGDT